MERFSQDLSSHWGQLIAALGLTNLAPIQNGGWLVVVGNHQKSYGSDMEKPMI